MGASASLRLLLTIVSGGELDYADFAALKLMKFALKLMKFAFKMMDCVLKMMNCALMANRYVDFKGCGWDEDQGWCDK